MANAARLARFGTQPGAYAANYTAAPILADFHRSEAFIRGVRGPRGSGKSVSCVMEMVIRAHQQAPDRWRRRRSRFAAIRNTYAELKKTTMATWKEWVPETIAPINLGEPMTARMILKLPDGTTVDMEVVFISCDKPADVGKLKSMENTAVWLNEASELDKSVLDMATATVGRFPNKKDGVSFTWAGIIMDTNSMDDDHWWYALAEGADDPDDQAAGEELKAKIQEQLALLGMDRPLMQFWEQPPALLEADGSYVPNPACENANNQPMGFAYWLLLVAGKSKDWIDLNILNKYGKVIDGKPVYSEYDDQVHGKPLSLTPIDGMPIRIGMDFGLSPAAVPGQCSPMGKLLVFGELVAKERSMGMQQFINDALKPYLVNRFGLTDRNGDPWRYIITGDPAGDSRSQNDEVTGFDVVRNAGFDIEAAPTNNFSARRDGVAWFLNKREGFAMDKSAISCRKGLRGGYHYRRVQVGGDARYADTPYKNKYSHPGDALQYLALPYVAVEVPAYGSKAIPEWAKKLPRGALSNRAWTHRAGR
ncbi:MAG: phage terminase large subunit [Hyphomicrobiales bacterium]|nr:phage terminase large subunit [Hyphomicrobiales bacterium]